MIARRALWQIGLGVLLGTPPVAWMFYGMREYSGLELSSAWAVATAFLPGMGVMILVALLACTAPTLRVLRIEPSEVLKAEG